MKQNLSRSNQLFNRHNIYASQLKQKIAHTSNNKGKKV